MTMKTTSSDVAKNTQPASTFEEMLRVNLTTWKGIAAQVNDPVTARLIVETLDEHPKLRERRFDVYLAARVTVQRSRIQYARARDAGRRVAAVWLGLKRLIGVLGSGDIRRVTGLSETTQATGAEVRQRHAGFDLDAARAHGFTVDDGGDEGLKFPPIAFPDAADQATLH